MVKAHLLVIEDENDISRMLKIYFIGLGYVVDVAESSNPSSAGNTRWCWLPRALG